MEVDKVIYQAEANAVRLERTISRLWILLIIMLILLVGSNVAWICYERQFEDTVTTVTQDVRQDADSGSNTFVGGDYNGETEDTADSNN